MFHVTILCLESVGCDAVGNKRLSSLLNTMAVCVCLCLNTTVFVFESCLSHGAGYIISEEQMLKEEARGKETSDDW